VAASGLSLRPATEADRRELWRIHSAAVETFCPGAYSQLEVRTWVDLLRPDGYLRPDVPRTVLVAEQAGRLVGFGQLDAELGELEALYVEPGEAGHGVGSTLLTTLELVAWRSGARTVNLDASLNAEPFYRARGYQRLHAARRVLTPEVQLSCVRMQKRRPTLPHPLGEGRGGGSTRLFASR
jgi:N-acetylglutamate synthase-like GNAT family acetyltransferase